MPQSTREGVVMPSSESRLLEPNTIGPVTIPNRLVSTAHGVMFRGLVPQGGCRRAVYRLPGAPRRGWAYSRAAVAGDLRRLQDGAFHVTGGRGTARLHGGSARVAGRAGSPARDENPRTAGGSRAARSPPMATRLEALRSTPDAPLVLDCYMLGVNFYMYWSPRLSTRGAADPKREPLPSGSRTGCLSALRY